MATAAKIERAVVGAFGFITGLAVVGVPAFTTFPAIKTAGTVGGRTVFPYASTWMNSVAFVVYAWPKAKSDWPVVTLNMVSFVVESGYCFLYIRYSAGWNRVIAYVMLVIQLVFGVGIIVLQVTYFANGNHHEEREIVFGWIGAITAVLMYISPAREMARISNHNVEGLSLGLAVRHHNVEGLSLGLSLAFLGNASIWTGYTFIDPFNLYYQLIANSTGIVSAIVQIGVWLYRRYHGQ